MAKSQRRPPWKRANPRKKAGQACTKLTPSQKGKAKTRAKRAARHYPNLVDNMRAAAQSKNRKGGAAGKRRKSHRGRLSRGA